MTNGTMRAARVHQWGTSPTLDEVDVPVAGDGESLVRVEAAAVAHLDRTVVEGNFDVKPGLPYIGGVEGCGVVVESDSFSPGTRVLLRGGGLGVKRDGTWAEYVTVATKHLTEVPDGMSPELGATYFVPVSTAAVALNSVGHLGTWWNEQLSSPDDEIVIVGGAAGVVGSMIAQIALLQGARVMGLVKDGSEVARLAKGVEPIVSDNRKALRELESNRPATILVDTLGGDELATRTSWVRPGGRAVLIGYVAGTTASFDLPNWLLQDVPLLPINMMSRNQEAKNIANDYVSSLVSGELFIDIEEFALGDVGHALELLDKGELRGRAVVDLVRAGS